MLPNLSSTSQIHRHSHSLTPSRTLTHTVPLTLTHSHLLATSIIVVSCCTSCCAAISLARTLRRRQANRRILAECTYTFTRIILRASTSRTRADDDDDDARTRCLARWLRWLFRFSIVSVFRPWANVSDLLRVAKANDSCRSSFVIRIVTLRLTLRCALTQYLPSAPRTSSSNMPILMVNINSNASVVVASPSSPAPA